MNNHFIVDVISIEKIEFDREKLEIKIFFGNNAMIESIIRKYDTFQEYEKMERIYGDIIRLKDEK